MLRLYASLFASVKKQREVCLVKMSKVLRNGLIILASIFQICRL